MLQKLLILGLGGSLGTISRFGLHLLVERYARGPFPWPTLIVNVLGCFLFGWVWTFSEKRLLLETEFRTFALIGFLAAFTTFSTFAFQTFELFAQSKHFLAALNLIGHNGAGILALMAGAALGSR